MRGRTRFLARRGLRARLVSLTEGGNETAGEALLDFRIRTDGAGACTLTQTAFFEPKGVSGLMYWYAVLPLHCIVFGGCCVR